MASTKTTPRDALVMASILKDMGIIEYEPRVINQMLEFTYRYITNILDDARVFSSHAKKKSLDVDDVKLAIQMQMDKSFTTPPPRDILIDISRQRNSTPLPLIKPHCGLRLPPDRYCLSACNYHVKATKKPRQLGSFTSVTAPKINLSSVSAKVTPAINLTSKSGASLSLVNKANAPPTVTIVTRPSGTGTTTTIGSSSISSSTPTPIIKFSSGGSSVSTPQSGSQDTINTTSNEGSSSSNKIPILVTRTVVASSDSSATNTDASGKRKREIDDDYDVE